MVPAGLMRLADRMLQRHRRRQGGHKRVARFTGHHVFRRGLSRFLRSPVGSTYDLRSSVTGNDPATESNRGRQLHLVAPDSPGWPTSGRMSVNPGCRRDKDRTIQGTTRRPGDPVQFNRTLPIYSVVVDHVDCHPLSRGSVPRSKATATKTDRSLAGKEKNGALHSTAAWTRCRPGILRRATLVRIPALSPNGFRRQSAWHPAMLLSINQ